MKERIITAICLLAVVLPLIYLGGYWFIGLILVAATIAVWEMMAMHDKLNTIPFWGKFITFAGTLLIIFDPRTCLTFSAFLMLFIFLLLIYFLRYKKGKEDVGFRFCGFTLAYISFSFRALLQIREHSLTLYVFLIAIVILTDSMAYFAGRFFGRHKLAPKISPKKTVEGAIGGWLAGASFAIAFGLINHLFTELWILVLLAISLPILSQIGDLAASALKRRYGIKDFGKMFPGHGGVMDRVDSQMLGGILLYIILHFGGLR